MTDYFNGLIDAELEAFEYDYIQEKLTKIEIESVEERAKIARIMIDRWIAWSGKIPPRETLT